MKRLKHAKMMSDIKFLEPPTGMSVSPPRSLDLFIYTAMSARLRPVTSTTAPVHGVYNGMYAPDLHAKRRNVRSVFTL
jgi:hypothetical protein